MLCCPEPAFHRVNGPRYNTLHNDSFANGFASFSWLVIVVKCSGLRFKDPETDIMCKTTTLQHFD